MPSKSRKQHNLMAAVANNPKFAKKVGIPQSVGEDYVEADKGRNFKGGGPVSNCGSRRMMGGGKVRPGYHRMPDGEVMADSAHRGMMCGGKVHNMADGGKVRGCGVARKGFTKGRMV